MSDGRLPGRSVAPIASPRTSRRSAKPRRDEFGRAFAGSQLQIQCWVNCRTAALTTAALNALGVPSTTSVEWISPRPQRFREFRDGAFLNAVRQNKHLENLRGFWPKGGPVWDGLGLISGSQSPERPVILVEAKSYPEEVHGGGCKAKAGSKSLKLIEQSLDQTAAWLGIQRSASWLGELYRSANRIAHVYFLREIAGVEAYMLNVCFEGDPHKPTTAAAWADAHKAFAKDLGIAGVGTPWLANVVLPAAERSELLKLAL